MSKMRLAAARSEIFYLDVARKAAGDHLRGRRVRRIKDSNGKTVTAHVTFETLLPANVRSIGGFDIEISKADLADLVKAWKEDSPPVKKTITLLVNYVSCQVTLAVNFDRGMAEFIYREIDQHSEAAA